MAKNSSTVAPVVAVKPPQKPKKLGKAHGTEAIAPAFSVCERRLLHELQVHQIELEMQNLELSQFRDRGEALLDNYTELYDFAPVGYCTLDRKGTFQRINMTGSSLLGDQSSGLINHDFSTFVSDADKPLFSEMLATAFNGQQKKAYCEVVLHPKGLRPPTPVKIVAMASVSGNECLAVVIDITERKRLEAEILTAQDVLELRTVQERSLALSTLNTALTKEVECRKKLEATLRNSQLRLRNLSAHLQYVREEERKAIAREVHDELGQMLAAIQLSVSLLSGEYSDHHGLNQRINDMNGLVAEAIKTVQRISSELRPVMLDVLGLADAMEWQGKEFNKRAGIACSVSILLLDTVVHPDVSIALFRLLQESLTNVQRHSGATTVEARLVERNQHFTLTVRDNGKGITADEIASPHSLGLIGQRERVIILGGRLRLCGSPGLGTVLVVRVPIKPKGVWHVHGKEDHHSG